MIRNCYLISFNTKILINIILKITASLPICFIDLSHKGSLLSLLSRIQNQGRTGSVISHFLLKDHVHIPVSQLFWWNLFYAISQNQDISHKPGKKKIITSIHIISCRSCFHNDFLLEKIKKLFYASSPKTSKGLDSGWISIGSGNGLVQNRLWAIAWNNDDRVKWCYKQQWSLGTP